MNLNIGKIRITEEIDTDNDALLLFKFKQNKIEYYCTSVQLLDEREGYLAFSLPDKLGKLFKNNGYSTKAMIDLFEEKVDEFYFVSFEDEDANSQVIEYCGHISKEDVLKLFSGK